MLAAGLGGTTKRREKVGTLGVADGEQPGSIKFEGGCRSGRGVLAFALLLLVLVAAILAVPALSAPPRAAGSAAGGDRARLFKVLSPSNGGLVRGGTVRLRLRLLGGASLKTARLNGRKVTRLFKTRSRGIVVGKLSTRKLGKRLKRGRNFIHLTVSRGKDREYRTLAINRVRRARSLVRRFRVAHKPGEPVRVTLVPSKLHTTIKATLNGRHVSKLFRRSRQLKRKVSLGASDGLRHGRNRLRLTVSHYSGQYRRLQASFTIPRGRTIAGAGRDRTVPAGGLPVRLNGKASKPGRHRAGKGKGKLRYKWKVVSSPTGSHPDLEGRSDRKPRLRTDVPGTYKVRLRTSGGASGRASSGGGGVGTSSDVVETQASAQPFVQYDAFATEGGQSGISVQQTRDCTGGTAGDAPPCFYPNTGQDDDLQVVVVDREALNAQTSSYGGSFASNTSYDTSNLAGFAQQMQELVGPGTTGPDACPETFDDQKLVLLSLRSGGIADTANWEKAMGIFNQVTSGNSACTSAGGDANVPTGAFAGIGIPGMLQGKMWTNYGNTLDSDPTHQPGNLVGYLSQTADDPTNLGILGYTFSYQDAFAFNTRDTSGGGTDFTIGSASAEVPDGNGLAVFSFDPIDPEGTLQRVAFVGASGPDSGLAWANLNGTLENLIDNGMDIGIVSSGQIGDYGSEPQSGAFLDVQQKLNALGANADTFARAVNANEPYSMVSTLSSSGRNAYQSSGVMAVTNSSPSSLPLSNARITGVLERGPDARFYPVKADPSGYDLAAPFAQTVQQTQHDWQLTPAPSASGATCQELAFAYIVWSLYPDAVPGNGGLDALWQGSDAQNCEGVDHTGTTGPASPDNLDGDQCASADPDATGAEPVNVRETSLTLRASYQDLSFKPNDDGLEQVSMPSDPKAPFTQADLTCAKNQMGDEFAAQEASNTWLNAIQAPFTNGQLSIENNLQSASNSAQNAALSGVSQKLDEPPADGTASFWAQWGLNEFSSLADVGVFVAGDSNPVASSAFTILSLSGYQAENIFWAAEGPGGGNPAAAADQYLLLQSQLSTDEVSLDSQIANAVTAQANGIEQTAPLLNSDPGKLATVYTNTGPNGPWQFDDSVYTNAQAAYQYRVTQLAYQQLWPQLYTGVRYSWNNGCWYGSGTAPGCFNNGIWDGQYGGMQPIQQADQIHSCKSDAVNAHPVFSPYTGTPVGLGAGAEYQPQIGVAASGQDPQVEDYMMLESDNLSQNYVNNHKPGVATQANVEPFFTQPTGPTDTTAAGFYPPDFWQQNLPFADRIGCSGGNNKKFDLSDITAAGNATQGTASIYQGVSNPTDIWPTLAPPATSFPGAGRGAAGQPAPSRAK